MKDTIREIILANMGREMIMQALEDYVVDYMKTVDMKAIAEYIIDDISITEIIVEVATELFLPF